MKSKESYRHLMSIFVYFSFKHGVWMKSIDNAPSMGKYWDGPLFENKYFLGENTITAITKKDVSKVISQMFDFDIHPVYNRDFFEGLLDSCCQRSFSRLYRRFRFKGRDHLREFLDSDEHGYTIPFEDKKHDIYSHRTKCLPFLYLPCRNELDKYFAGVLSGAHVLEQDGEVWFRVKRTCIPKLTRLGVNFRAKGEYIYLSSFYFMLMGGMIPPNIYSKFLSYIEGKPRTCFRTASLDAAFHWRLIRRYARWKYLDLPFLWTLNLLNSIDIHQEDIQAYIEKINSDFVDKRLVNLCNRWYIMAGENRRKNTGEAVCPRNLPSITSMEQREIATASMRSQ